ncbi:MAG: class I SAM-dependent methyltransferase [Terriglobia bacterium]
MSKKHRSVVQKQFTKTVDAFSKFSVRDTPEMLAERSQFARPQPGEIALDVACGPGTLVLELARIVRFARGIDITHPMLLQAREFQRERNVTNTFFDQGEAERLPYPDHAFDLVTCQFSFHHMPKPEAALKEMLRVTRAEGRIMIADTLGPESDEKWDLHHRIECIRDASHAGSLRLTAFLRLFEDTGLDILRQGLKRRQRSFNQWMARAGLEASDNRYQEARKVIEDSIPGDKAAFSAQPQDDDLLIVHNEAMFLLQRRGV